MENSPTSQIIPPKTLLDAICAGFARSMKRSLPLHRKQHMTVLGRRYIYACARDHIRSLLDNRAFVSAVREHIPHGTEGLAELPEIDYWRMLMEYVEVASPNLEVSFEDAPQLCRMAWILTDSACAELRGG